jgi:hypothetical protein
MATRVWRILLHMLRYDLGLRAEANGHTTGVAGADEEVVVRLLGALCEYTRTWLSSVNADPSQNPALMATKTSILLFYLTLSKTQKIFRWATIVTLVVVNVGGLALTILNILQCRPIGAAWSSPVPNTAHCTNIVTIYLSSAPLNIITDTAILFLPMPILTSMRLPKKQKIILVVTFGFGIFVAVVDVIRIAYLQGQAPATNINRTFC